MANMNKVSAQILELMTAGIRRGESRRIRTDRRYGKITRCAGNVFLIWEEGIGEFTFMRFENLKREIRWVCTKAPTLREYIEPIPFGGLVRVEKDSTKYAEKYISQLFGQRD